MADEQTLLQAVLENPNDDAPRHAYAAWCDSQPDNATRSRAELIRGQIRLFRDQLDSLGPSEIYGLRTRMRQLQDKFGALWTEALRPYLESYTFQRGFVELVRLTARNFLDHAPELFAQAPIQHVDLTHVREVTEELFDSKYLGKLRSLSMDASGLYDIHVQLLAASPHAAQLRWLSLQQNNLTLRAAEALAESPYLKDLQFAEFRGNPVNPAESVGLDGDQPVTSGLPRAGHDLEAKYGPLVWLHRFEGMGRFSI